METTNPTPDNTSAPLDSAQCPSCGFFIGPMLTCPRCGARSQKRIAVRAVRIFCIIGSVVGVALLWVASYMKTPEVMHVKDITELTINAMATIKGTVVSVRENPIKKSLTISIDDGTAPPINMLAFGKLDEMRRLGRVPRVGDKVEVTGNISVSQQFGPTMMLAVPERLVITERVKPTSISDLTADDLNKNVLLQVAVDEYSVRETQYGPMHNFKVSDNSGSITLAMNDSNFKKLSDEIRAMLTESSQQFEVSVQVGVFRDEVNAKVVDISSIKPIDGGTGSSDSRRSARPADNAPAEE